MGKEEEPEAEFPSFGAVVGVNNLNELDIIRQKTRDIFSFLFRDMELRGQR